jgi:hypothetical protein
MHSQTKRKLNTIIHVQNFLNASGFKLARIPGFKIAQTFQHVLGLTLLFIFFPLSAFTSPVPALGSSALSNPSKAYIFHMKGFSLNPANANWKISKNESHKEISATFSNGKTTGVFSVKTETLVAPTSVEHYSKRWIRDYAFFGFDVLGAKPFNLGSARGYVIDLYHKKQNKQVRQVIFLKEKTSVILTCADELAPFKDTLNSCNSVVRTFSWL